MQQFTWLILLVRSDQYSRITASLTLLFSRVPQDTQDRLAQEEEARNALNQAKKKLEQELNGQKKDIEDLELTIQKGEQDKATKDHQIRNLNDEIAHQDELIGKLNKEKKQLQVCERDAGISYAMATSCCFIELLAISFI